MGGRAARPLGHAESDKFRAFQCRLLGKEFSVGGIGAGPATLDIGDAQPIERLGNNALVLDREIHPLSLRTVAQRRVDEINAILDHVSRSEEPTSELQSLMRISYAVSFLKA